MMHLLKNSKRNIIVASAGIILVGVIAIVGTISLSAPTPLSADELVRVHNAIHLVAPGDIRNLTQNRDGSVTVFVTDGHYSKQTVVAKKVKGEWTASVTMQYF